MIDLKSNKAIKAINYVVVAVILIVISVLWYQYRYKPLQEELTRLEQVYKKKNKELDVIKEMKRNLEKLDSEVAQS